MEKEVKGKILYIGGFDLPDRNAAAQRVLANAKIFRLLGFGVVLIGLTRKECRNVEDFDFEGFKCINLPYPKSILNWFEYLFTIKWYKQYINEINPELVIAYNHPAVAIERLLYFDKCRKILTLADCTEWYEPHGNLIFNIIKRWDVNRRMYVAHMKMDALIVTSQFVETFYKSKGKKTLLLPSLVDIQEEKWNVPLIPPTDTIQLIYVGFTGRNKERLDMMISAIEIIQKEIQKDISFQVIGMTEKQYKALYQVNSGRKIPSYIHFLGKIKHKEAINKLCNSDFQIFLRDNTLANKAGFPTKFSESITAGVITLCNITSDIGNYMIEGENGYSLDYSNMNSLVDSLRTPLHLTRLEINEKKAKIDREIFDYRRYVKITNSFLDALYG